MEFYNTEVSECGKKLVMDVLNSGYLNQGKYVKDLEEGLLKYFTGMPYNITTNSCTAAIHIALKVYGREGREVYLPGKTFIATAMAVKAAGYKPIFLDIDPRTKNINEYIFERARINNGAPIIGVSWGGRSCVEELRKIKQKHGRYVIEDAAHAFGNYESPDWIDARCYSFQAIKALSCGDGGCVAFKDKEKISLYKSLKWFGIDKDTMTFNECGERIMKVTSDGYKFNMNDLNAALLTGNLTEFYTNRECRKAIHLRFNQITKNPTPEVSSYWLFGIYAKNSRNWIAKANKDGIPARKMDSDISKHFGDFHLPNTKLVDEHEIYFPCHHGLTIKDIIQIEKFLQRIIDEGDFIPDDKLLS